MLSVYRNSWFQKIVVWPVNRTGNLDRSWSHTGQWCGDGLAYAKLMESKVVFDTSDIGGTGYVWHGCSTSVAMGSKFRELGTLGHLVCRWDEGRDLVSLGS